MRVYLATAYPTKWSYLNRFADLANSDRFRTHTLVEDPALADLILFVDARAEHGEWHFRTLRRHPLVRTRRQQCFVYDEMDQPWCSLPGLYVSMPATAFQPLRQRACAFVTLLNDQVAKATESVEETSGPTYLFSFQGRNCHPIRSKVLELRHPRALIEDTTRYNFFGNANKSPAEMDAARLRYAIGVASSKFVLCPRGTGTASFRLFEAMAAGRVPVIISDDWVPIGGPDWSACSVRIPEWKVGQIPSVLEGIEPRWSEMAAAAQLAWSEHFAPNVLWHRMIEACADLMATKKPLTAHLLRHMPSCRYVWLWLRHARAGLSS